MRSHWVSSHPRPPHHGGHPRLLRCDSGLLHSAKLPSNNQIRATLDLNANKSMASTSPWHSGTTGDWLLHTWQSCLSNASGTRSSVSTSRLKKESVHLLHTSLHPTSYKMAAAWLEDLGGGGCEGSPVQLTSPQLRWLLECSRKQAVKWL